MCGSVGVSMHLVVMVTVINNSSDGQRVEMESRETILSCALLLLSI